MGPSIGGWSTSLVAVWKGNLGDQNLYWSQFNRYGLGTWSPKQIVLPGAGSSPDF
jgi:hypothetical protein